MKNQIRRSTYVIIIAHACTASCSDHALETDTQAESQSPRELEQPDDIVEVLSSDSVDVEPRLQRSASRITRSFGTAFPLAPKPAAPSEEPAGRPRLPSNRQALLAAAESAKADDEIRISILLPDVEMSWRTMERASSASQRESFIKLRQDRLRDSQSRAIKYLSSIDAKNIVTHWIANSIDADVKARHVPEIVARGEFNDVAAPVNVTPLNWDGGRVQDALRTGSAHALGIDGHRGSKFGNGRIKIGVVEGNIEAGRKWPPRYHAGWKRSDTRSGSRLVTTKLCGSTGCTDHPTGNSLAGGHGALVAEIAAGSIEAGQDPSFPGTKTAAQRQRSGQALEAYLRYYLIASGTSILTSVETAVRDGVDVLNLSWEVENAICNPSADVNGSLNAALVNATNAGTIVVVAAGNRHHSGPCNISYPALRSEVLAVGQLDSSYDHPTATYASLPIHPNSSRGGVPIRTLDGGAGSMAGVGVIAPGCYSFGYNMNEISSNYGIEDCGTSFAAPAVSGMLGIMRHAWWQSGFAKNDARMMIANALLMGDGWNGSTIQSKGLDPVTGAGRPRLHWPSNNDLAAPWGWGQRAITIRQGETVTWPVGNGGPMSASVSQWKWATLFTWTDPSGGTGGLANVPDIDFYVDDVCNGGTSVISYDTTRDTRARFRLGNAQISGKCLRMRAYGYAIPPSGATFYSVDYFHSGDPNLH